MSQPIVRLPYNLIIQPEAEYDIQDAFEWYESQNPGLGSEFIRAVDACLSGIARNSLAYQVIHKQARRALIRRFTYILEARAIATMSISS